MTGIRKSRVNEIDAAQQALSAARREHGDGDPAVRSADDALNAVVRDSTAEELTAWAALANARQLVLGAANGHPREEVNGNGQEGQPEGGA